MKFQVTLHKDDWKWVFTQLAKFTFKHSPHYRLDCVAIRSLPSSAAKIASGAGSSSRFVK